MLTSAPPLGETADQAKATAAEWIGSPSDRTFDNLVELEPTDVPVASPAGSDAPTRVASANQGRSADDRLVESDANSAENSAAASQVTGQADPTMELNLPTALAMIGGQHPAVGLARWRVQEAYAQLMQAESLWLPSIQSGFSFHRHDGNYQASNGEIVDVNRNSFQYGLGAGATGAGTTPRPGLVARFHLADALFLPQVAEKRAWAQGHAAKAVVNEQLLRVAIAYFDLLAACQDASILQDSSTRAADLTKLTTDFAAAGQGLRADADRVRTEQNLVDNRLIAAREEIAIASARLAQALSMDASVQLVPLDVTVVPLELTASGQDKSSLIGTALAMRPELKESQALVAAACEAYRRQKYAPFVPSVLLGFSTGGFGGGLGNDLNNVEGRYDFDALVTWEVRNLGFGEHAARRQSTARLQQAKFEKIRVMDQVAREVSEACSRVEYRRQRIEATRQAIASAEDSYRLNVERIRDGQGLPLEALQSLQALESARRAYLQAVVDFNQAQFQLQWALGWQVTGPA
ncbi:TolC family protein [Roseiconus nitratireducens]|uniref:TolC family protein n=2 Tax=Roseiconus nitratireducens TaxID=2605748 RepID=A0A5M6DIP4_9BACT|nr:TolC family protein [Roseiconus nitratireducens]